MPQFRVQGGVDSLETLAINEAKAAARWQERAERVEAAFEAAGRRIEELIDDRSRVIGELEEARFLIGKLGHRGNMVAAELALERDCKHPDACCDPYSTCDCCCIALWRQSVQCIQA